jgi:hypothetical protein
MKRFINPIRVTVLICVIGFMAAGSASAQNSSDDRKAAKKAKKEEAEKLSVENTNKLYTLMEQKQFVLEANTLFDRSGMTYQLNSNLNFVGFDGKNATIQLAFEQLVGWNGVGGITLDGTIENAEVKKGKNDIGTTATINVRPKTGGMIRMVFRSSSDGNARVDVSGAYGDKFSFQGRIVSLAKTTVYKGTPIF